MYRIIHLDYGFAWSVYRTVVKHMAPEVQVVAKGLLLDLEEDT
jgi:hypothetical protein